MRRRAHPTLLACLLLVCAGVRAEPPFSGTVFLDPDVLTAGDAGTFMSATYAGRGLRLMFDRRVNAFVTYDAYLFDARFSDGLAIEVQANPEFAGEAAALQRALVYLPAIGRLPRALRAEVRTIWLHRGDEVFGGGNQNLLIHDGSVAAGYLAGGVLEEVFLHEAVHTSLDAAHATAPGWQAAQATDGEFISTYARDFPTREDLAESVVPWLAVRLRAARLDPGVVATIGATIPARLAYLDGLGLDLSPMAPPPALFADGFE